MFEVDCPMDMHYAKSMSFEDYNTTDTRVKTQSAY